MFLESFHVYKFKNKYARARTRTLTQKTSKTMRNYGIKKILS